MAATGKTPILLYGSTTPTNAPTAGNLTNSSDGCEIAINVADKNLFFKDSTNAVNTVPIRQSSASSNGWLSSTDWSTFNSKQPAGTYVTSVTGTAPVVSSGGTTPAISMAAANGSTNGYLTSTDWTTFNSKQPAGSYALTTGTLAQFASTTSAQLAGVISDETGSGKLVFATSPSLTTPNIGVATGTTLSLDSGPSNVQTVSIASSGQTSRKYTLGMNTSSELVVYDTVAATARMTFDTSGNAKVDAGNLIIGTAGYGIDFSATAGTGTSELLADYEEGTWTPTQGVGLTVVGTFSSSGTYTKVGRLVTVTANLNATTSIVASSGGIACGGLPYTVSGAHVGSLSSNALNQSGSVSAYGTNVYSGSATTSATGLILTVTYMV